MRLHNIRGITFGLDVFISSDCCILANSTVTSDDEVMLGAMCIVVVGDHTLANRSYQFVKTENAPIFIIRRNWIRAQSVIIKGVTLGRGVCVTAGAALGKSFPDGANLIRQDDRSNVPSMAMEL